MRVERINNLWGPADVAPAPADMVQVLAKASFDALVLIELRGRVSCTRHAYAREYLREVRAAFHSAVTDVKGVSLAAATVVLKEHRPSLELFGHAEIRFAFDEQGLIGMAPTHFYRGLP